MLTLLNNKVQLRAYHFQIRQISITIVKLDVAYVIDIGQTDGLGEFIEQIEIETQPKIPFIVSKGQEIAMNFLFRLNNTDRPGGWCTYTVH